MADALWHVMVADGGVDAIDKMLIFLPSRRAVRVVEKMIADKMGGAAVLPRLVALGEGADENIDAEEFGTDVVSNTERVCMMARLLAADAAVGTIAAALPIARDLVRMADYMENEGINPSDISWDTLVDERYAAHFQAKARMLNILSAADAAVANGRVTEVASRNRDIRAWIDNIARTDYSRIIVCASTASVPATADLMAAVAGDVRGRIILPGRIAGRVADFDLDTNPYNSEYKFLTRIGVAPADVIPIDVGASAIDFFNVAFGNVVGAGCDLPHISLVECNREAEESAAAAEIAARAVADGKSVLVITPDAAGNQRLAAAFAARGVAADFSGGVPGTMTPAGRAILNLVDSWIERGTDAYEKHMAASGGNLGDMLINLADASPEIFSPAFLADDPATIAVFDAVQKIGHVLVDLDIHPTVTDARALIADALSGVSMRANVDTETHVSVIGTIESRMQTADVVILTGLVEGIFPARGYENAWLPRDTAAKIGLPAPERKVSLMSLDFMNLSCGSRVYWLRSRVSGGVQTTESRFLSRVAAHRGRIDLSAADDILSAVRAADDVAPNPLSYAPPTPPADWSDVYVTELELLIHNPYAFYARHILRLRVLDDYWIGPDARTFGNLVHGVLENACDLTPEKLVDEMDARAREIVGEGSVLYHFWHKRFLEIAPIAAAEIKSRAGHAEIPGSVQIAGRRVRARADRVWADGVMDIKTGAVPSKKQLLDGNMPQLPLEAFMHQSGGFVHSGYKCASPEMVFLQLKSGDVRAITFDADITRDMMNSAVLKVTELFNIYSAGAAPYEWRVTSGQKYNAYEDLARVRDI